MKLKTLKLISQANSFKDKIEVMKYFLTKDVGKCEINISKERKIFVRKDSSCDLMIALDSNDKIFNYVKEMGFKRIVDVGANIGKYSLLFSENRGAEVISFEPIKSNYKALLRNIEKNHIKNIKGFNFGCYDYNIKIEANLDKYNDGAHSIFYNVGLKKELIEVKKLDDIIKDDFKPNFIKIDVEGVELNVLKGAINIIRKHKPVIFIEISRQKEKIIDFLMKERYSVQHFDGNNYLAEFTKEEMKKEGNDF